MEGSGICGGSDTVHSRKPLKRLTGMERKHASSEALAPASPSRGLGNGILRAETGGRFQAQNAGEPRGKNDTIAGGMSGPLPSRVARARGFWLDRKAGWRIVDGPADGGVSVLCEEHNGTRACPHCS